MDKLVNGFNTIYEFIYSILMQFFKWLWDGMLKIGWMTTVTIVVTMILVSTLFN